MLMLLGWGVALLVVFGGFVVSGGHLEALFHPVKLIMIVGAGAGAFIASCSPGALRATLRVLPQVFRGPRYTKTVYTELLCLLQRTTAAIRSTGGSRSWS